MSIITPRATEKAYGLGKQNTYVFNVPLDYNKQQIATVISEQFGVKVKSIKVSVQAGKSIRFNRGKNRYPGTTSRKDTKKAYVTLVAGSTIKMFDQSNVEEENK